MPDEQRKELSRIYSTVYAPAVDKFLETRWYTLHGEKHLLEDDSLCDRFINLIPRYQIDPHDPSYVQHYASTVSLEASLIWSLMCMCREATAAPHSQTQPLSNESLDEHRPEQQQQQQHPAPAPTTPKSKFSDADIKDGVHKAAKRLEIIEALLTGEYLSPEPVNDDPAVLLHSDGTTSRTNGTVFDDQLRNRQASFWHLIHAFLTLRDDEASSAKEIDDAIISARNVLDSKENRDVIYSIVIIRHIGQRMAEQQQVKKEQQADESSGNTNNGAATADTGDHALNNDEQDARTKLHVAKTFIEEEAKEKGTNQVVMRICGMAATAWLRK